MVTISASPMSGYDRQSRKSSSEPDEVETVAVQKKPVRNSDGDLQMSVVKTGDVIGDMIEIAQRVDGGCFLPIAAIQKAYIDGHC